MEIWKEHPRYAGLMVSSHGRFKMPQRHERYPTKIREGCVTWAKKGAKHNYRAFYCRTLGNIKVHQLVRETFHGEKPYSKAVVMHLDGDGLNNHKDNLAWGSQKENLNHPAFIAYCKGRVGEDSPTRKGMRNQGQ